MNDIDRDRARTRRVLRDRAEKARSALVQGGYLESYDAGIDEAVLIDFLTDFLHLVPDAAEAVTAPAWLVQASTFALGQFRRELESS